MLDRREIVVAHSIEVSAETARASFQRFGWNHDEIVSAIPSKDEIGRLEDSPIAHLLNDETGDYRRDFCLLDLQSSRVEIYCVILCAKNDLLPAENGCNLVSYEKF